MKNPTCLALLLCAILSAIDCKKVTQEPTVDCQALQDGLVNQDPVAVKKEINLLCADLAPNITKDDPFGQKDNLPKLAKRISGDCDFCATVTCYNCVKTYPPMSLIVLTVNLKGKMLNQSMTIGYTSAKKLEFKGLE